jgi:hypothetical protein
MGEKGSGGEEAKDQKGRKEVKRKNRSERRKSGTRKG